MKVCEFCKKEIDYDMKISFFRDTGDIEHQCCKECKQAKNGIIKGTTII